jgi:hypothetical protein
MADTLPNVPLPKGVPNVTSYFENDTWVELPSGVDLVFEVMRDSAGNNSGGLFGFAPSADPGQWNDSPCAALRVERWQ